MKIGIDASRAFETPRTGVGEYAFELISELVKNTALLKDHEVVLFVRAAAKKTAADRKNPPNALTGTLPFALPANWRLKPVATAPFFWTQLALLRALAAEKPDLLFSPSAALPLLARCPTVYVFHGGEIREVPGSYSFWARIVDGFLISRSLKKADAVIAVTSTSAEAARAHYDADRNKITVICQGVNWRRGEDAETAEGELSQSESAIKPGKGESSRKLFLSKPYILYLGAFARRKNVPLLIEAYNELRRALAAKSQTGEQPNPPSLVLAGPPENSSLEVAAKIEDSPFKKDIKNLGYVEESVKQDLLRGTAALAAPSLAEGFGRTVLEALCYEKPVVVADIQTFRELYGTFGHLVIFANPQDSLKMARSLEVALAQPSRETALARARESAKIRKKYSWETAAVMISRVLIDTARAAKQPRRSR